VTFLLVFSYDVIKYIFYFIVNCVYYIFLCIVKI
jgi:hypothetical protein